MNRRSVAALTICLSAGWLASGVLSSATLRAQGLRPEPQLLSTFPLGATRGSHPRVEIRGQHLGDVYAVWTDCSSITAEIKSVEAQPEEPGASAKAAPVFRVSLKVFVSSDSGVGTHFLRVVSPLGVSNPLSFIVYNEPVTVESDLPADAESAARRLPALPIVVSGKIGTAGEVDTYSFEAQADQELFFEVLHTGKLDPQLSVLEPAGSWFDPQALKRLAFNDEPNTASKNLSPALSYRFDRRGRYLVTVGGFLGRGGPDSSYQLRIVPGAQEGAAMSAPRMAHEPGGYWQERSFARALLPDRLKALEHRTVVVPRTEPSAESASKASGAASNLAGNEGSPKLKAQEAKFSAELALIEESSGEESRAILLPALIEGTIEQPGDADRFRFRVNDGARLAFELETPATPAPLLAPRIGVFDEAGQEILNNVFAFVQGSGEFIEKVLEPKVTCKFERGGEYSLEIRDLTSRNGGPDFHYRVVIRQQIPHVGRVEMASSFGRALDGTITRGPEIQQLNLAPGETKKIGILTEHEEGFEGQVALGFEGLPPGVEVFPATEVEPERARPLDEGKKERFRPSQQVATILLSASTDAATTRFPVVARLKARPVVNGKVGQFLHVQTLPVMVVKPVEDSPGKLERRDGETQK